MTRSPAKQAAITITTTVMLAILPATASAGSPTIVQIGSGQTHTCALISTGKIKCWNGSSSGSGKGELGNGSTSASTQPVEVSGVDDAVQLAVGQYSSCAVLSGGSIKCWGDNTYGELGNGGTCTPGFMGSPPSGDCQRSTPVAVSGITTATQVTVGTKHACARLSDGSAKCWGDGGTSGNALGYGPTLTSRTPVTVFSASPNVALSGVEEIRAGSSHTCARLTSGAVRCWGWNSQGQLGTGNTTSLSYASTAASGVSGATSLALDWGNNTSCSVVTGGKVKCSGNNGAGAGLLGTGSAAANVTTPETVRDSGGADLANVASLSLNLGTTCATGTGGSLLCWGTNGYTGYSPRLDTGATVSWKTNSSGFAPYTYLDAATEFMTAGSVKAVALGASGATNCVITADGSSVKCWPNTTGNKLQEVAGVLNVVLPPDAPSLSGAPSGTVNLRSAIIGFSSTGATSYTCSLDGGAYAPCVSPKSLTDLPDGQHSFAVKAANSGGESGATTATWTVDSTPPAKPVLTGAPSGAITARSATLSITAEAGATLACKLDAIATPCSTSAPVTLSGLAVGSHTFTATATDAVGNTSTAAAATWTVAVIASVPTTPPAKTISGTTSKWTMLVGKIFTLPAGADGASQFLTVQVSTQSNKPSDTQPIPTKPSYADGILAWDASGILTRSGVEPKWVRIGNRVGLWTGWAAFRR